MSGMQRDIILFPVLRSAFRRFGISQHGDSKIELKFRVSAFPRDQECFRATPLRTVDRVYGSGRVGTSII